MPFMGADIVPRQKADATNYDQKHNYEVDQWVGDVSAQRYKRLAGSSQKVKTGIALKQAIDQLPEEEAQLIKFRYMDNLSQAETAKRMGKNQVSVSRSERKILEKLRRKML